MLNKFGPYPQSFRAGVDSGPYFKTIILIKEHSIKDITFSSSIFSDNSDYGDMFFLVSFVEPIDSILIYDNFLVMK